MKYEYKTQPRGKQKEAIEKHWHRASLAFLCRPGTGKSKLNIDHASLNFLKHVIDAWVVVAPEGVDRQWIEEAVPDHMPNNVKRECYNYRASMGKLAFERILKAVKEYPRSVMPARRLLVLTFSFDGIQTPRGKKLMAELFKTHRYMMTVDESHRVSNAKTAGYKAIKTHMRSAKVQRIATGTLIRQNPFSSWGQFELMQPAMLGFATLASFKSMYAEMLPEHNRLVQAILQKVPTVWDERQQKRVPRYIPQVQAKDELDRPVYRNLADLRRRLEAHSVFLTLADVNGEEPVVNQKKRFVGLNAEQRTMYDDLVRYGVAQAPGGQLTAEGSLALSIRLAQVAGGHAPCDDDWTALPIGESNPKLRNLLDLADELEGEKLVIWCKFTPEIRTVCAALRGVYGERAVVEYHGRMDGRQKDASKRGFIDNAAVRFFVGQQRAGGTGLDGLQGVASYMAFYSNDYPYLERLQAISRLARTNGASVVNVYDIIAEQTIDEDIVATLRTAQDVSEAVLLRAIVREWE